jgi:arylformamidase
MSAHAGTHVDAPFHFIQDAIKVDKIPVDTLVGPAWVCVVSDSVRAVTADVLEAAGIPSDTRRLLLATSNSALWAGPGGHMSEAYVYLSEDAAGWLVRREVSLVGIDYLSVDPFTSPDHPAHSLLLSAGIVIVEVLDLRGVPSGPCGLWCLPLRIAGGDGAPARVILGWEDQ